MRLLLRIVMGAFLLAVMTPWAGMCACSQELPEGAGPANPPTEAAAALPATVGGQAGATAPQIDAKTGSVTGTVIDANGDLVGGANVALDGPAVHASAISDGNGAFAFEGLPAGGSYRVTITAKGFDNWVSQPVTLAEGEFAIVKDIRLKISNAVTSVTVSSSIEQIATEQVALEEKQRIFGIIPNFYVVYDSQNAAPMTARLKFQMALRVSVDPVSFLGTFALAGIDQAADSPGYVQGWKGYGERAGSVYADGFTDTMFGGAILPALLHQDPRYYYKGTGTIRSRALHAMAAPFLCKGDNRKWQPNISSVGGDLISASISNAYYPASDRGAALLFENVLVETAERSVSTLIQEFLLRKWTPSANGKN